MKTVYALGSCRLMVPLIQLHRKQAIDLSNAQACWYTHSAAEIVQRLGMLDGSIQVPPALLPLVLDADSCAQPWPGSRPSGQAIGVFEISTRRLKRYGGLLLHTTAVSKAGFTAATDDFDPFETVEEQIRRIRPHFSRLILSCNIVYGADLQQPNPHRLQLNNFLKDLADRMSGVVVVDPNEHLGGAAPAACFLDPNHFQPAFAARMSAVYGELLQGPA